MAERTVNGLAEAMSVVGFLRFFCNAEVVFAGLEDKSDFVQGSGGGEIIHQAHVETDVVVGSYGASGLAIVHQYLTILLFIHEACVVGGDDGNSLMAVSLAVYLHVELLGDALLQAYVYVVVGCHICLTFLKSGGCEVLDYLQAIL